MYNSFIADYDSKLNEAFGSLKAEGITDLVLDLRYNGGGSVQTATRLASMITGQFNGKVFANLKWNQKLSLNNEDYLFPNKIGSTDINSLNLNRVYVITTKSTASASELIINGLKPYIDVVQIGDVTYGKSVASITLYDSESYTKQNVNPRHRYAMQLIVAQTVNSLGFGDYKDGLVPTVEEKEIITTFGVLGDVNEPLLKLAIGKITGTAKGTPAAKGKTFEFFKDAKSIKGFGNEMYLETIPEGLLKSL
jgi:C-terminal processing protease CtpA/Prc